MQKNARFSADSQWALAATICPSRQKIETILEKRGIKRGAGWSPYNHHYIEAKNVVFGLYNLSGQEYGKAINIITEYLKM